MENSPREESSSHLLDSLRAKVKWGGFVHLLYSAMTIPCIIAWILFPVITGVKYEYVSGDGTKASLVFHGQISGWRLLYPTLLLIHFAYVMFHSLQLINASQRGSPKDLRVLYQLAAKCLGIQRWILRWDIAHIVGLFAAFFWVDAGILETKLLLAIWSSFGTWFFSRFVIIRKLAPLVDELREARDGREIEVAEALGNFRNRR